MDIARLLSVSKGEIPADIVLTGGGIINVFTGEVETGSVAISEGRVAGIGDYYKAKEIVDLGGRYLAPGFINGHTHIESSMLDIGQYARAIVPRGTTTVITDLHEIANVCGMDGIKYVMDSTHNLPVDIFLMAPSCVPATILETSGAVIGVEEIHRLLRRKYCIGLGEVMNFPGVLNGDENILHKISLAQGKAVDGHAPSLTGKDLDAYIAADIHSDHESVSLVEAREKLKKGMFVMIREGSSEKNLDDLLPLVNDNNFRRCMFVTDDRNCVDLLNDGDIDAVVVKAIKNGLEPVRAIQLATINAADYFHLGKLGAIAPGYLANLIVIDDLSELKVNMVFYQGKLVAKGGESLFRLSRLSSKRLNNTVNIKTFGIEALKLTTSGNEAMVIEIVHGQIVTRKRTEKIKISDGVVMPDIERDILKLVVVERHKATGNIGLGLVRGFGIKRGAIASSVAHDSHNIIAVGTYDEDIYTAIKEVERLQGGLVVTSGNRVTGSLALPIAGLLSDEPLETVVNKLRHLEQMVRDMGSLLESPFTILSFLALPVIPELRLTDLGLIDVNTFRIIDN